jgi:hypothetical protein
VGFTVGAWIAVVLGGLVAIISADVATNRSPATVAVFYGGALAASLGILGLLLRGAIRSALARHAWDSSASSAHAPRAGRRAGTPEGMDP